MNHERGQGLQGVLLSILGVLGFGHVTVYDDGFEVKRCLKSARFAWGDVEEVSGTLTFGYGTFSIVLSGKKELQLCFDMGTMALISAFVLKLPGFPHDWFSQIRDNGPDDFFRALDEVTNCSAAGIAGIGCGI